MQTGDIPSRRVRGAHPRPYLLCCLLLVQLLAALPASAAIYKCVGPDGSTSYSDNPCTGAALPSAMASPPQESSTPAGLSIQSAAYASPRNGRALDVTRQLQSLCSAGAGSCLLTCGNQLAGDPDFGQQKYCRIAYQCGGQAVPPLQVPEGTRLRLACPAVAAPTTSQPMSRAPAEVLRSPPNAAVSYGPHELEVRALNCETSYYNAWIAGHRHPFPDRDTLTAKFVEIANACRAPLGLPPMVNKVPPEVKPVDGSAGQGAMENFARLVRSGSVEAIRTYLSAPGVDVNERAAAGGVDKTLLDYAAELDQMPIAQYLLENGARVDDPQVTGAERGLTPLHRAARAGAADMAGLLLAHGAEINAHGPLGNTPLMYAASSGSRSTVEVLLAHGADIATQNGHLQSAISIAAATGYTGLVDLIASRLPAPSEQALDQAAARADVPGMNLMMMHDALVHDVSEAEKQSALRLAVLAGTDDLLERKQVIDLLLAHGADLNDPGINSPYTRPVGLVETPTMLQFLITKGAALRIDGSYGPIVQALACGSQVKDPIGMFTVLLAQGVDIAAVPAKGEDALECAVRLHRLDFEAFLLNHGVPADLRDSYGHTAASLATDPAALQLLIDHGADPHTK